MSSTIQTHPLRVIQRYIPAIAATGAKSAFTTQATLVLEKLDLTFYLSVVGTVTAGVIASGEGNVLTGAALAISAAAIYWAARALFAVMAHEIPGAKRLRTIGSILIAATGGVYLASMVSDRAGIIALLLLGMLAWFVVGGKRAAVATALLSVAHTLTLFLGLAAAPTFIPEGGLLATAVFFVSYSIYSRSKRPLLAVLLAGLGVGLFFALPFIDMPPGRSIDIYYAIPGALMVIVLAIVQRFPPEGSERIRRISTVALPYAAAAMFAAPYLL